MNDSAHIAPTAVQEAHSQAEAALTPSLDGLEIMQSAPTPSAHATPRPRTVPRGVVSAAVRDSIAALPHTSLRMPTPGGVPYSAALWDKVVKSAKDAAPAETTATDTIAPDTTAAPTPRMGMIIDRPAGPPPVPLRQKPQSDPSSWIILGLVVLFLLVALRFRRNFRYLHSLVHEMVSVRRRRNMFTDTVRETTFVTLLNLLCIVSVSLWLAWGVPLSCTGASPGAAPGAFPHYLWPCLALVVLYYALQWIAYSFIGWIFLDGGGTRLWLQGFRSGQGLLGLVLFPLGMVGLFWPESLLWLAVLAVICYFAVRLAFVVKGIKIFYGQRASYLLFLYYLCGVEIVPVLLMWRTAENICGF